MRGAAGDAPATLAPGQVARIFTGAPVPAGADTVLMQEDCEIAETRVRLPGKDTVTAGQNIRPAGQDARRDDVVMERGDRLTPQAVGLIASVGIATVKVNTPRVLILTSGDEIQSPEETPLPGKIFDSNGPQLTQLLLQSGFVNVQREHLPDDPAIIRNTLTRVLTDSAQRPDVIISTGGVSVGEEDHLRAVLAEHGELDFWRLAIKPGKPVWLGRAAGRLVMGLPGNPTSALVTARLLLAPLLAGLTGRDPGGALAWRSAPLAGPLGACGERETFVRARREGNAVHPLDSKDSSAQRTLAVADLLVRRAGHAPAMEIGDLVEVLDF